MPQGLAKVRKSRAQRDASSQVYKKWKAKKQSKTPRGKTRRGDPMSGVDPKWKGQMQQNMEMMAAGRLSLMGQSLHLKDLNELAKKQSSLVKETAKGAKKTKKQKHLEALAEAKLREMKET